MTGSQHGASEPSVADVVTEGNQLAVPRPLRFAKDATASFVSTVRRLAQLVADTQGDEARLKAAWPQMQRIKQGLDSGKVISGAGEDRGLPLHLVIQLLKSSWHADSTWPVGEHALEQLHEQAAAGQDPGPQAIPDPSPDEIAIAYRMRGVDVPEPALQSDAVW